MILISFVIPTGKANPRTLSFITVPANPLSFLMSFFPFQFIPHHLHLLLLSSFPVSHFIQFFYPSLTLKHTFKISLSCSLSSSHSHFFPVSLLWQREKGRQCVHSGVCSITPAARFLLGRLMERSMSPDRQAIVLGRPGKLHLVLHSSKS